MSLDDLLRQPDNRMDLKWLEENHDLASRVSGFQEWLDAEPCTNMHTPEGTDHEFSGCIIMSNMGTMCPVCRLRTLWHGTIHNAQSYRHHYLIYRGLDEDDLPDYEIDHDPDCPHVDDWLMINDPQRSPFEPPAQHYTCAVQNEIDNCGLESLDPELKDLKPGRYEIKYWFSWSGSMFDDSDGGIRVEGDRLPLEDNG